MTAALSDTSQPLRAHVVVHPLVLLSVVDAYNQVNAGSNKKRAVGVLLGQHFGNTYNAANSFAVPFEEDEKNSGVWYLDHDFVDSMTQMMKKINAKEKIIGWYHTGPRLRSCDLEIHELMKSFIPNPVLVIIDVQPKGVGLPTDAYLAIDEIKDNGSSNAKTFVHIASSVEAEESEEIGVEHLLRDIRDSTAGSLSMKLSQVRASLEGLDHRLQEIADYLEKVVNGTLPLNNEIIFKLQDIFNLLPNLTAVTEDGTGQSKNSLQAALITKTNDQLMTIYLSSLVRAVMALHDLIDNKIQNRQEVPNIGICK